MRQSHEYAGQRSGHRVRHQAGVLDDFPRRLQQQSMLRVEGLRFALVDAEELGVEAGGRRRGHAPHLPIDRPAMPGSGS